MVVKAFNLTFVATFIIALLATTNIFAQKEGGKSEEELEVLSEEYNDMVMHHIGNANEFHVVGDIHIPLPCILYAPDDGFRVFMSSKFHHGSKAIHGYVLDHGVVKRILGYEGGEEANLDAAGHNAHENHDGHNHDSHGHNHDEKGEGEKPGHDAHDHDAHYITHKIETVEGKEVKNGYVSISGKEYQLERSSVLLPGMFTSWYDFSISKNVFAMLLATLLMFFIFTRVAKGYKKRQGQSPKGIQSFMEPVIIFIRDEVAIPAIGPKWERYFPFILCLFFFVLFNNIFGIIPFFPFSANVTGNISTTLALAMFTLVVTNLSGNKHYWGHIFWMPGIPTFVKPILSVIEFFGIFIKPFTLFIRLFANITAGHIIILSLVGLIWMFGGYGDSMTGSTVGSVVAFAFVAFINILELFVAFLQAFIFALLSALYIGSAVEEHHHEEAHH